MDPQQLRQLQQKVEQELRQRELAFMEFWLQELKAVLAKRHQELGALQNDLKSFAARMETRIKTLKGSSR